MGTKRVHCREFFVLSEVDWLAAFQNVVAEGRAPLYCLVINTHAHCEHPRPTRCGRFNIAHVWHKFALV